MSQLDILDRILDGPEPEYEPELATPILGYISLRDFDPHDHAGIHEVLVDYHVSLLPPNANIPLNPVSNHTLTDETLLLTPMSNDITPESVIEKKFNYQLGGLVAVIELDKSPAFEIVSETLPMYVFRKRAYGKHSDTDYTYTVASDLQLIELEEATNNAARMKTLSGMLQIKNGESGVIGTANDAWLPSFGEHADKRTDAVSKAHAVLGVSQSGTFSVKNYSRNNTNVLCSRQ